MGSTSADDLPVTRVRISQWYWLGRARGDTVGVEAVMGTNPSRFCGCGLCPADQVSREDAGAFVRQLNGSAGGVQSVDRAEWEYAERAGTVTGT